MFSVLQGKLSYLLAALAVLWALVGYFAGWVELEQALTVAWGGLAVFGIRRAIK